ncbi:MAG: hypothetical protein V1792_21225 [Pseudomonadota bacterium]
MPARNTDVTFGEVLHLYEAAGFLYDAKKRRLAPYLIEIRDTWNKLLTCPNDVFHYLHTARNSAQSSSLCIAQYWERTWMLQHAVSLHDPRGILRNLMGAALWADQNPCCDYVRFLYRPENRWPRRFFGSLMTKLPHDSYETRLYGYYVGRPACRCEGGPEEGVSVDYLSQDTAPELHACLVGRCTDLYMDSKGLRPDRVLSGSVGEAYSSAGLVRNRSVLVARRGGDIVGYSLLDYASLGINLSFLFNAFLLSMTAQDEAAESKLVEASINHYVERGRSMVVGLTENGTETVFNKAGLQKQKEYCELTIKTEHNLLQSLDCIRDYYASIGGAHGTVRHVGLPDGTQNGRRQDTEEDKR